MKPEAGRRKPVNPDAHSERPRCVAFSVVTAAAIAVVVVSIVAGVLRG